MDTKKEKERENYLSGNVALWLKYSQQVGSGH